MPLLLLATKVRFDPVTDYQRSPLTGPNAERFVKGVFYRWNTLR
jgi:hypothetical protein